MTATEERSLERGLSLYAELADGVDDETRRPHYGTRDSAYGSGRRAAEEAVS